MEVECAPKGLQFHLASLLQYTAYQGEPTSEKGECGCPVRTVLPVNNQNRQVICCGSVLLQETYGPYVQGKSKNAQTKPMISSCCSKCWYKDSTAELEKWAVVSWGIWNARNKVYIERVQPHPKAILVGAVGFLQEYQNLTNAQRNNG